MKGKNIAGGSSLLARSKVTLQSEVHVETPGAYDIYELVPKFMHALRGYDDELVESVASEAVRGKPGRFASAAKWLLPAPDRDDGCRTFVAVSQGAKSRPIRSVQMIINSRRSLVVTDLSGVAEAAGAGITVRLPAARREKALALEYVVQPQEDPLVEIEILQGPEVARHLETLERQWLASHYGGTPDPPSYPDLPDAVAAYFVSRPISAFSQVCEVGPDSPVRILPEAAYSGSLKSAICVRVRNLETGELACSPPLFLTAVRDKIIATDLPMSLLSEGSTGILTSYLDERGSLAALAARDNLDPATAARMIDQAVAELGAASIGEAIALLADPGRTEWRPRERGI